MIRRQKVQYRHGGGGLRFSRKGSWPIMGTFKYHLMDWLAEEERDVLKSLTSPSPPLAQPPFAHGNLRLALQALSHGQPATAPVRPACLRLWPWLHFSLVTAPSPSPREIPTLVFTCLVMSSCGLDLLPLTHLLSIS